MIAAIVLAAGKSERMGQPKALLPLHGRTFLDNILEAIASSGIEETIVVVGHHREIVDKRVVAPSRVVFNADYEQGMVTSFQAGIRALPASISGALLFLVDHPVVDPRTIQSLLPKAAQNRIVIPTFGGKRGHPVLFASDVLQEILGLTASQGANIVVRRDPNRVIHVPVESAGILVDVDTPEDFQKLQSEHESR